jgi:hypothetical protein
MLQIKTVICPLESPKRFDDEVNRLLSDGWTIRKREIQTMAGLPSEAFNTPIVRVLYAELERHEPPFPEEITI